MLAKYVQTAVVAVVLGGFLTLVFPRMLFDTWRRSRVPLLPCEAPAEPPPECFGRMEVRSAGESCLLDCRQDGQNFWCDGRVWRRDRGDAGFALLKGICVL